MAINAVPGALTAHDVEQVSMKDPEIKALRHAIKSDEWKDLPQYKHVKNELSVIGKLVLSWLVGCFGFNGPLRQYFSLYRAVSQREGERGEKGQMREKMSKQPPPAPTASATGPCTTINQISRTPRHWKFTQHLRTTRPPPN